MPKEETEKARQDALIARYLRDRKMGLDEYYKGVSTLHKLDLRKLAEDIKH